MEFELTPEELSLFLQEAEEQLEVLEKGLVALEEDPADTGLLHELFRAAHTLKGGAATAGFQTVAGLTHAMESLLDALRRGIRTLNREMADSLFEAVDLLKNCLANIDAGHGEGSVDTAACAARMRAVLESGGEPAGDGTGGAPGERPGKGERQDSGGWDVGGTGEEGEAGVFDEDPAPGVQLGEGQRLVEWIVRIDPRAAMASVRAYQVLLELGDRGTVVLSAPTAEELEAGGVQVDAVRVVLATDVPVPELRDRLREIPEVTDVAWRELAARGEQEARERAADGPVEATAATESAETGEAAATARPTGQANTVRIGVDVLDRLMNLVAELVIDRTRLAQLASHGGHSPDFRDFKDFREELAQLAGHLNRVTSELQDTVMQARMMPVATLFKKFPRMVRDLSKQLDKPVDFEIYGEETELDRSVIEKIGDPLIHLIRNALDHGVESPDIRRARGKPEKGRVTLRAYHQENQIVIEVSDDGKGLDPDRLRKKAVEKGLVAEEQAARLSRDECVNLIFAHGFSTAESVSAVSGRGVGLDVVRRNIEAVSGSVAVESEPDKGTTFRIKLPLTLAIIHALMVAIRGGVYAIPISNVVEGVRVSPGDVNYARGWPTIRVRGEMVPLLDPGSVWGEIARVDWGKGDANPVVVIRSGGAPIGLLVDRFLGEQEIVVKSMGPVIGRVPGLSGASILGDGRVALIVDVASLLKEAAYVA